MSDFTAGLRDIVLGSSEFFSTEMEDVTWASAIGNCI